MTPLQLVDRVIGREGAYVNHPDDKGGETIWGITKGTACRNGYMGPMRNMPRETAIQIYINEYLVRTKFVDVLDIYPKVAEELFDSGVNLGVFWPAVWLQTALNAFNNKATHYADIDVDGALGPASLKALRGYKAKRGAEGETVLLRALNAQQGARYLSITKAREANESFTYGWFLNRVD